MNVPINKQFLFIIVGFSMMVRANVDHINDIPDLTQTDVKGLSAGNGQQFCGPVAVANSLAWLSGKTDQQVEIAKKLASKSYMNTSLKNGTGTTGMLRGISRIAQQFFGGYRSLQYQGWRKHPQSYSMGVKVPQLSFMKKYISDKSAVWLNIGWYQKQSSNYIRVGGHWLTMVGYQGEDVIIVHDPSPRAGHLFANEYVHITTLKGGHLTGNKLGLPISANGFMSLGKGMHMKSNTDYAIIDGVITLSID